MSTVKRPEKATELPSTGGGTAGLSRFTAGAPLAPLAVLFGLNFVDQFDLIVFQTLGPEMRDHFVLTDASFSAIAVLATLFMLLAALPVGYLGDRFSRVKISVGCALLFGTMSILTGLVWSVIVLIIARFLAGIGRIASETIHPSLLGDYYRPDILPRTFLIHRMATPLSGFAGLIAGFIGAVWGWRWAFFVLAVPTFFVILAAARLREPLRGETIDSDMAQRVAEQGAVPFAEARRQLFAVRTLRRLWLGAFLLGIGWIPIGLWLSFFFEQVYDYGPDQRGIVTTLGYVGGAAGLLIGAAIASRIMRRAQIQHLATVTGLSFLWFALCLFLLALSPWPWLSLVFTFLQSVGTSAFLPAYLPLVGMVAPPRVRSQAYSWAVMFVGLGGVCAIPLFAIGDEHGYRWAIAVLSGLVAVSSFIGMSAFRFVRRDVEQASKTLETAVKLHDDLKTHGSQSLLVCRDVEVAYDQVQVLFGVDMDIKPGEIIALLGTNGAGKSTLLKAISGLVEPIGGAIFYDGRDITHADAVQTARLGIIQVPGGKAIFPTLTVAEHFKAATWLYTKSPEEVRTSTEEVLEMFPRLQERWDQMAGNMSGGEQQMLALGMAFIAKPKLLMIDELSLGLAPTVVEQLLGIVRRIHDDGATIIIVEQSVNVALTVADRAYFMEKGEVRFEGPTEELLERGDILRSVFLEGAASQDGDTPAKRKQKARAAAKVRERAGDETTEIPLDGGPVVLDVRGLTKRFGGITAVDDVSFELRENEILGLIGPNGAGKTTIFDLISGHLPHDAGRLYLKDVDITDWPADRRAALGLGRSFQDARIFPAITVAENIALGLERHIAVRDHLAAVLDLPAVRESEDNVAWTVDDLIDLMGLGAFRDKFVSELSTGSRRIVDLAMSIAHDPTVLLLDEPSSGIAQKETEALGPLLKRIQRETTCSILVIEHDMPLINSVSDEIIALELGRVVLRDLPDKVMTNPRVIESYLGGDLDVIHRSGEAQTKAGEARR